MRRAWLLGGMAVLSAVLWWFLHPADTPLHLPPASQPFGLLYPSHARGAVTAPAVVHALAQLAPASLRITTEQRLLRELSTAREQVEFGFTPELAIVQASAPAPAEAGCLLPGRAILQLRGMPHGYLIVHCAPVAPLLTIAARRQWLDPGIVAAAAKAIAGTITVGENEAPRQLVATFAFEYRTGEDAEAALQILLARPTHVHALAFTAHPGTERITRQTKLLVIRFDLDADLALQALRQR